MDELLKVMQEARIPAILVVGGIFFLFLAIGGGVRFITGKVNRLYAGLVGIGLLLGGLGLSIPISSPPPLSAVTDTPLASTVNASSTETLSLIPTDISGPSPTPRPECRFNVLYKCSSELVPIFSQEGKSYMDASITSGNLVMAFSNNQIGSGLALRFNPALNVEGFSHLDISGTSTQPATFLIEYKIRSGEQLTIVTTSPYQSFSGTFSTSQIFKIPLTYNGKIDEVVINFYNIGESSTVVIDSMRLSQ